MLSGATCLDLFAGSGVLGIEAASIGARKSYSLNSILRPPAFSQVNRTLSWQICTLESADARSFLSLRSRLTSFSWTLRLQIPRLETAVTTICERGLLSQWLYLEFDQQQENAVRQLLQTNGLSLQNLPRPEPPEAGFFRPNNKATFEPCADCRCLGQR